jgi:hypothetical protein
VTSGAYIPISLMFIQQECRAIPGAFRIHSKRSQTTTTQQMPLHSSHLGLRPRRRRKPGCPLIGRLLWLLRPRGAFLSPTKAHSSRYTFMTTLTMFLSTHLLASMSELPLSWEHETLPRVMIAAPSEASHVYWTVVLMLAGAPGRLQTISRTSEDFPVQRRPGGKLTLLRRIQKRLFRVRSPKALDPRSSIRHRRLPTCPPAAQDQLCSLHRCRSSAR